MRSSGASLGEIEDVYRTRAADFSRLAFAHLGNADAARDAVQEGFARAVKARSSFRRTGILDAWVARCVINAARDQARSAARFDAELDDLDAAERGDADLESTELRQAVRSLPPRQRDVLFLRFYLDFDYATIAETLGIAVGTVSATLHVARVTLADVLEEVPR